MVTTSVRRGIPALVAGASIAVAVAPAAHAQTPGAVASACPGSFSVLHNDRIGRLSLPAGPYQIRATGLSCASASQLFARFLADWDGRLPRPWRLTAAAPGRGTFTGAAGQSFSVQPTSGGGGGGGGGLVCGQRIRITQNDRIGPLVIKKGRYLIDRLSPLSPSCARASVLLGRFLQDFDGNLPNGWTLLPDDATFVRGSVSYGFRLEPDPSGGGGKRFPRRTTRCPATFQVRHNDRIGALRFPAGAYWVSIFKSSDLTCAQSTQLFASFLARPDGRLPKPWVIDAATGSFRRGTGSAYGFVAKPAFNAGARTLGSGLGAPRQPTPTVTHRRPGPPRVTG